MTFPPRSHMPTRKVTAAGAVGIPAATILAWVLSINGIQMPPEVAAAAGGLLSTLIAYFVPDLK